MAAVLVCLILFFVTDRPGFAYAATVALVIDMAWPMLFYHPSRLWFGLAHVMGTVVSKILLSLMFFIVVTPVGVLRRATGADSMQLKKWKKGKDSVFKVRDHKFEPAEIEKPY